ncbi:MAG: hypothetical protein K1X29_01745 [Bdellovibrionales bacterium]|nr:hypothetical protein [Bdellovibrionales bacterium]
MMPPLFVLISHNLQMTAMGFSLLSIYGLVRFVRDREFSFLKSPFLLGALIVFAICDLFLKKMYFPHQWDEYSYWLLMPKQMVQYNAIVSNDFPYKTFMSYLPGLSLWQSFYYFLIQSSFSEGASHTPNFAFALALIPPTEEFIKKTMVRSNLNNLSAPWIPSLFCLIIFMAIFSGEIFYPSALIEPACYIMLAGFLLFFYRFERGECSHRTFILISAVFLIGGYYLKQYMILGPVALIVAWIFRYFFEPKKREKTDLKYIVVAAFGFIVFYFYWVYITRHIPPSIPITESIRAKGGLWQGFLARSFLLAKFVGNIFLHFTRDFIIHLFSFWGIYLAIKNRKTAAVFIFWGTFFVLYLGTLGFYYIYGFSDYEAGILASFHRYLSYLSFPLRFLGALLFIEFFLLNWARIKIFMRPMIAKNLSFCFPVLLMGFFYFNYLKPFPNEEPLSREVSSLISKDPQGSGLLIAQNDNGEIYQKFQYYSVDKSDLYKRIQSQYSFALTQTNVWVSVVTEDAMKALLKKSDFLWIYRSDFFVNKHLYPLLNSSCPSNLDHQLLIKVRDRFECHRL